MLNEGSSKQELSNVMYIGRFPHGFYEDQMRAFFTQFGDILNLRVSRNKKTGASKHYAYIQFATPEVTSIVANAMDGYMLLKQKLRCSVLRKDEVHPELWKGANRKYKPMPRQKLEMQKHNKPRTSEESAKRLERALKRDKQRAKALAEAGIDYSYQPLAQLAGNDAPAAIAALPQNAGQAAGVPSSSKKRKAAASEAVVQAKAAKAKGRLADLEPTAPVAAQQPSGQKVKKAKVAPKADKKVQKAVGKQRTAEGAVVPTKKHKKAAA